MIPRIRSRPEDFVVDEIPLYEPEGAGPHTFVRIEKRGLDTDFVARALARAAGVSARDVGYAGRKDRHAVTRQWFSVPDLDPERALSLSFDSTGDAGARVLSAVRHRHKLRTGQLRGNHFVLVVRDVEDEVATRAESRADEIRRAGFANRFGPQRFGRDGANVERARRVLRGEAPRGLDRRALRFLLSSLQAAVFNEVLAARPLRLDEVEKGEIAVVAGSNGPFLVEDALLDSERAARLEIHPSGPIFGTRKLRPEGAAAERENAAHAALGVPPPEDLVLPRGVRLKGARRALRALVDGLAVERDGPALEVSFGLDAGCYATVLLAELLGEVVEGPSVLS